MDSINPTPLSLHLLILLPKVLLLLPLPVGNCWLQNNPQWAFWMEPIPCRKLWKRLEPPGPVPSGVSVSPPGVCPIPAELRGRGQ